jgi:hypothetical protein
MNVDDHLDAWFLWFWLGFSLAFVILVWIHHLCVHNKALDIGESSPHYLSRAMRIMLTCIGAIGVLGAAGVWQRFGAAVPWTALAFGIGVVAAFLIAVRLYGSIKRWGQNPPA